MAHKHTVVIFGASSAGNAALQTLKTSWKALAFCDNDERKHGKSFCGLPVISPKAINEKSFDLILIASCYAREIFNQLIFMGVPEAKIQFSDAPPDLKAYADWKLQHANRLEAFRNLHAGEDCFILGNGPSLNRTNLEVLNAYHTFALNKIYLLFDRSQYRPSYHVAINKLVIEQSVKELEAFDFPSFVSYAGGSDLVTASDRIFFLHTGYTYSFSRDATDTIIEGSTVTYAALQLAYFMGFSRVFLVGVDHSFSAQGNPHEKQKMGESDPNHFDPRYFANQDWQLPDLEGSEASYLLAKTAFETSTPPRQIFDATIGGKLRVYPKLDYESALRMARPKQ